MPGTHLIDRGSFKLVGHISGPGGDAPWMVLSNSLGASSLMWWPQMPLLEAHYNVLVYDTRGHGDSDAPEGPYSFNELVSDVVALMNRFDIAQADFMGLSLGGMTGLGLALAHSKRIKRLICCDARADAPEPFAKSWDERIAAVSTGGMEAVLEGTMERWFTPAFRKREKDTIREIDAMFLQTSIAGYKGCAQALKTLNYLQDLGRIGVPTLYVGGSEDVSAPPAVMREMAEATPGAGFAEIADAAHIANINNQKAFDAAIANFLGLS